MKRFKNHKGAVIRLALLQNGDLVSGSADKTIKVWNMSDFSITQTLEGHDNNVTGLAVLDDERLASASLNVIIIWNLTDGTQIKRESQQATVSSLVSLSDSTLAIGFQNDLDIRIWDLNTDIKRILSNEGYVYSLGTYSKNQILIAGSSSFIKIWNWESSTLNQTIKSGYGNPLSLFMDNLELVSGFDDKTIRVWNLIESKIKNNITSHTGSVTSLAKSSQSFASASLDGTIKIWNSTNKKLSTTLKAQYTKSGLYFYSLAVLTTGDLASGSEDGSIQLWNKTEIKFN